MIMFKIMINKILCVIIEDLKLFEFVKNRRGYFLYGVQFFDENLKRRDER